MASTYNFTLTDGTALTSVYALEGNGTGNLSIPRQILDINFDNTTPYLVVADDVRTRYVNGFNFSIIGGSAYDGAYTVTGTATIHSEFGKLVTHVPLAASPTNTGLSIVNVITGAGGSWFIEGPTNGQILFYPGSTFTVSGNSDAPSNGVYTVVSAITGNQYNVSSVVTGVSGKFIIAGNHTSFFRATKTFKAINTGGFDQTYTIASASLVSGNTEVTVTGTIPGGTTVNVNTIVVLNTPVTQITVAETIPATAANDGTALPSAPVKFLFHNLIPVVVSPTVNANEFDVKFKITGNHVASFITGSTFLPHGVLFNNELYSNAFVVSSATYDTPNNFTELVCKINATVMPAVSVTNTAGYQDVTFANIKSNPDSTGLANDATAYTATITIDGVAKSVSVVGSNAQTFATLLTEINTDLAGAGTATLVGGNIRISSATTGSTSSVSISDTDLFGTLTDYSAIATAVAGTTTSWITFPVPSIPYGYAQYTVSPVNTSLQLIGPGSPTFNATTTWGQSLLNNDIHLLENFSNTTAPVAPLMGQIWHDRTNTAMMVYDGAAWNGIVSVVWPVTDFVDMNNNKMARLADAATTYPYVASSTGVGNNDQEALNLRTSDGLYIAKTGGSDATAANRSGTMTGSLNMNGASPVGFTTTGINMNSAPIFMYGNSGMDFKTGGSGSITFETTTTGSITILGSGNVVVTNGNVTVGSGTDKVIVQNNTGSAPTVTFSTSTTSNAVVNLANNKIVNLDTPSDALDAANKAYVDSLVNGIIWIQPVKDPNLFDDSLSAPPVIPPGDTLIPYHKTYIVQSPGSGAWTGLDNRAVTYDPQSSSWVDILGRVVQIGDRFGVFCEPDDNDPLSSLPSGGLTGKSGKIVTIATTSPLTYTEYTPVEPDAFTVTGSNPTTGGTTNPPDRSPHYGHSYTFRGTWGIGTFGTDYKWIEFSGPQMLIDGAGLRYTGNILNVGAGFGITVNADDVQANQTDLDTIYLRRDGTVSMLGDLNMNSHKISNVSNPTLPNDAVNKTFADTTYVALAGSTMNASANITFNGGEILGLPATPSVGGAAASKTYVDNRDATRLPLAGGSMDLNANVTFAGTGEVLGLPSVPTTAGSAASKAYVDSQDALHAVDSTVVHIAGTETITGAKTFNATTTLSAAVNVTSGANITLSGGSGELLGLPATPSVGGAATSKTYVDAQLLLKSDDTLVVHKAGIETITGAKTFSAATVMNNSLDIAANGTFTNVTASTTGFTVIGTSVAGGGAYSVSLTAGQNTGGVGGNTTLTAGAGSTTGGGISITSGAGTATAGGNITLTSGAGPTGATAGNISFTAGNAALLLDPQGVWKINNAAPSGSNQAIVSSATSPASNAPSWQPIAHRVAAAPGSSAAAGNPGDWFADDSFFYVYGATGWRRVGVSAF